MKSLSSISETGLQISVSPLLIFSLLSLLLAVWLIFTIIIRYHWKNYGTKGVEILTMNFVYLSGSAVLIAFTIISALLYSTSAQ